MEIRVPRDAPRGRRRRRGGGGAGQASRQRSDEQQRARPRCRPRSPWPTDLYYTRGVQVPHIRVSTHKRYSAAPSRSGPRRCLLRLVVSRRRASTAQASSGLVRGRRAGDRTARKIGRRMTTLVGAAAPKHGAPSTRFSLEVFKRSLIFLFFFF